MNRVDLRSDTVTQPTPGMKDAMFSATLGDDVLGEDPTVHALEDKVASILGKEASIFLPSGTMANAIAIRCHTQPGDEIITEENSHIYVYEGGGFASLSGCSIALVPSRMGIMEAKHVDLKIRKAEEGNSHYPNGSLVCLENTSNRGGGTCYKQNEIDSIIKVSRDRGCNVHMDGARLFNASVSTGIKVSHMVKGCDTVSICLSKGLGAPVGSVLAGSCEYIKKAHRWRKMLGGGMRQAGILAAAGLYALEKNLVRLKDDHLRAYQLALGLSELKNFELNLKTVQTNMIYLNTNEPAFQIVHKLSEKGIESLSIDSNLIRLVTHLHITDDDIERSIKVFHQIDNSMD